MMNITSLVVSRPVSQSLKFQGFQMPPKRSEEEIRAFDEHCRRITTQASTVLNQRLTQARVADKNLAALRPPQVYPSLRTMTFVVSPQQFWGVAAGLAKIEGMTSQTPVKPPNIAERFLDYLGISKLYNIHVFEFYAQTPHDPENMVTVWLEDTTPKLRAAR